ncbi:hypothetical protein EXN66_Car000054 [Channa argus]|uniref:Uncharacterized protein n=1 Tax=Channa argus TaxID=215402 RepID=A0A6G1QX52_CHAAH|nr:hypothetical protein EXN66_Car000054 [Channa argus]
MPKNAKTAAPIPHIGSSDHLSVSLKSTTKTTNSEGRQVVATECYFSFKGLL